MTGKEKEKGEDEDRKRVDNGVTSVCHTEVVFAPARVRTCTCRMSSLS